MTGPKFLVDGMLGSLARKLRVFGFDTLYLAGAQDEKLLDLARRQHRIIVTADGQLSARSVRKGLSCIPVRGNTDGVRLKEVLSGAERVGVSLTQGPSRCALCNGVLRKTAKGELRALPQGVVSRHRLFYVCGDCGQVYWRGTHWKKLRRLRARSWPKKGLTEQRGRTLDVS